MVETPRLANGGMKASNLNVKVALLLLISVTGAGATGLNAYFYSDRTVDFTAHQPPKNSDPDKLDLAVIEVLRSGQKRSLPNNIPQLYASDESLWRIRA